MIYFYKFEDTLNCMFKFITSQIDNDTDIFNTNFITRAVNS